MARAGNGSDGTRRSGGQRQRWAPVISRDRLSEIIGDIYDCVLTPAKWTSVLETICSELSFPTSVMTIVRTDGSGALVEVSAGISLEYASRAPLYAGELAAVWGGVERVMAFPLDEVMVFSRAGDRAAAESSRYWHEWVKPQGLADQAVILLARDSFMVGSVGFGRREMIDETSTPALEALRLLGPHLRRAVAISNLFDMKTIEAATYASAFDAFNVGAILVDEDLSVVHANGAGKAILSDGAPLASQGGGLTLRRKAPQAMLAAAVADAARDVTALGQKGIGIPALMGDGGPCVIHVLPLRRTETPGGRQRAVAALFVTPAREPPQMPTDALTLIYDLTPAEARIFELICAGETQDAIAKQLGISRGTVKTHLMHVFDKTGCRRQLDLVKLAAGLTLPV